MNLHPTIVGRNRKVAAYSMIELMLALGIFAVGFIAVASVFPAAGLLQKRMTEEVMARHVGRAAEGIARSLGFGPAKRTDGIVEPQENWPWQVRGFPTGGILDSTTGRPRVLDSEARDYYWVALTNFMGAQLANQFQVYVFVLKSEPGTTYGHVNGDYANAGDPNMIPGVRAVPVTVQTDATGSARIFQFPPPNPTDPKAFNNDSNGDLEPDQILAGSVILDSKGTIHTVSRATNTEIEIDGVILNDPDTIWYGQPAGPGRPSPTKLVYSFLMKADPTACYWIMDNTGAVTAGGGDPDSGCPNIGGTFKQDRYPLPGLSSPNYNAVTTGGAFWGPDALKGAPVGKTRVEDGSVTVPTLVGRWQFSGLANGQYKISVTWNPSTAIVGVQLNTNAPFRVYQGFNDSLTQTGGVQLDAQFKRMFATDPLDDHTGAPSQRPFQDLGTYTINGGQLEVTLDNFCNNPPETYHGGWLLWDAVRIEKID